MTNKTDAEILAKKSDHHTHTYEHRGNTLYVYFDKKISMWVVQNEHQSTLRFDEFVDPPLYMRSLADIEALVAKDERIAELESFISEMFVKTSLHQGDIENIYSKAISIPSLQKKLKGGDL